MITVSVDGELRKVADGTTLGALIPGVPPEACVAVIRPSTKEEEKRTGNLRISTSAGEIIFEAAGEKNVVFDSFGATPELQLRWAERTSAAFGPFISDIRPVRRPHLYERDDVILGCGGYDPKNSFLIFSKSRHSADHGSGETGGIIGRVVSGRAVLDRWAPGDRISGITPVVSWADTSRSFTTRDRTLVLEDKLQLVTRVNVMAQGYTAGSISTEAAGSVEHMLLAFHSGRFVVSRASSTHILDDHLSGSEVPSQSRQPRREGTVTVRTEGRSSGGVYIYRADISASPAHSVVGQVVHGIELVRLAQENDYFILSVDPQRIDMLGLAMPEVRQIAAAHRLALVVDNDSDDRIVVSQEPGTTLDVLNEKKVTVTTAPYAKVLDIELFDSAAPDSCDVFRRITGLHEHDAGMMPLFMTFDDSYLFKPRVPSEFRIHPENLPTGEVPAGTIAMTNDSRKGAGLVGVRLSPNTEFGPTSEPFEGTNIIGRIIDTGKFKGMKEKDKIYIREVRP